MTVPICKNCKYFKPNSSATDRILSGLCTHPSTRHVHIISGNVAYKSAESVRNNEETCGKKGVLFEAEQPQIIYLRLVGKNELYVMGYLALIGLIIARGHQVGMEILELISAITIISYMFFVLKVFTSR